MIFFFKKLSFYYQESDFLFLHVYKKFNFRFKNILYQTLVQNDWQKGYTCRILHVPPSTKPEISRLQRQRQTKF